MQGYILHTQSIKDEDLIVYILSPTQVIKSFRFYGMRHSNILNGYKIDFELEENLRFLPRLKDVIHLGFSWILDREKNEVLYREGKWLSCIYLQEWTA